MSPSRIRRIFVCVALVVAGGIVAGTNARADGFYERKSQGWFFYDDGPMPAQVDAVVPASAVAVTPAPAPAAPAPASATPSPEPFSVQWLSQKMQILKLNAMNHPTEENLQAYMWAQRMMLDMSQNFADVGSKVASEDPYLNEEVRFPTAAAARSNALWQVDRAREEILTDLSAHAGLWFFFDSRCGFCQEELPTVKALTDKYHFPVRYISEDGAPLQGMRPEAMVVDRNHGTFRSFELKLTPAVVLVVPPSTVMIVAHGAMAQDELQRKIVEAAIDAQLVPQDLMDAAQLEKRGIISPADMDRMKKEAAAANTDDPAELVKLMREAVGRRMPGSVQSTGEHQ
jgi:conjugal transfer pilus assembly protein TraF